MQILPVEIRRLTKISEFEQVVTLQRGIWQMSDLEIQPSDTFVIAEKTGGETLGAFAEGEMVGFCLGLPAVKPDGSVYLHSHMLGVLPKQNNRGVGRALKLKQRTGALQRGLSLIEWTFDPLQTKNAYFNIERLGAVVRRCYFNLYGETSNALDAGLPTDRCVAEWWLRSIRVSQYLNGGSPTKRVSSAALIQVPNDLQDRRRTDPLGVKEVQRDLMRQLSESFAQGLAVVSVERTEQYTSYILAEADGVPSCGDLE